MKRIMCLLLSLFLIATIPISAAASEVTPITPSPGTVERVKNEILDGVITSHEDVLTVALSQYIPNNASVARSSYALNDSEDYLTITQFIESTTNSDQTQSYLCAVSSLLVTDEEQNVVTASTLYKEYAQSSASISEYQVYAVHTAYVYILTDLENIPYHTEVKLSHMATRIVYGSSLTLTTTLEQTYTAYKFGEVYNNQVSNKITNPTHNTNYAFYPSNTIWLAGDENGYFQTRAVIVCNGKMIILTCTVEAGENNPFVGTW